MVAAGDRDDAHNRACTDLSTNLHLARRQILAPAPVIAGVGYLLQRVAGPTVEATPLGANVARTITALDLQLADYARIADLVQTLTLPGHLPSLVTADVGGGGRGGRTPAGSRPQSDAAGDHEIDP